MSTRLRVLATGLGLGLSLVACNSNRVTVGGGPSYRYPHQEAYGRTMTCPDARLPPLRDGGVSPDAARCSFADAQGSRVVHVGGKVLTEAEETSEPGSASPTSRSASTASPASRSTSTTPARRSPTRAPTPRAATASPAPSRPATTPPSPASRPTSASSPTACSSSPRARSAASTAS
ncbi:hypothetical protein [Nannocystis pusilla]|uniref:hypothetical protein n=1 Tax=Nannocystis pusilla TaxID=889268 RepID=UPI003B7700C7